MSLTLASYNIHRCFGRDGRHDPERIREVLRQIDAQVMALQEVELVHEAPDLLEYLCLERNWKAIPGITMSSDRGHYGNAVLTSLPVTGVEKIDLSFPGREPRGALHLSLQNRDETLEVMATHLGLRPAERRAQVRSLLGVFQKSSVRGTRVLMGDLNEWFLWGRPLRWLKGHFRATPAPATFPTRRPVFALDRIWVTPRSNLSELRAVGNPLTRLASDHLPLVARIKTGTGGA